jgi:predicted DNA-binding transcriptional regulator YafY
MHNQHKILRVLQLISWLKSDPPKSMQILSRRLNTTERTVYRYLDMLSELGFHIMRDGEKRVYIEGDSDRTEIKFTAEELGLLKQLLQTVTRKNVMRDAIMKKLFLTSDVAVGANDLFNARLTSMIESIREAIDSGKRIQIRKYQSVNSNKLSDRLVEPIRFTPDYRSLAAYEVSSGVNKYFNLERIGQVVIHKTKMKFQRKHKYSDPDVFGYASVNKPEWVELILTRRAAILLGEEYPGTLGKMKKMKSSDRFKFSAEVQDFKPVIRFVLGLLDDVEIVGNANFIDAINTSVQNTFKKKTRNFSS